MSDWLSDELEYKEKMDSSEAARLAGLTVKSVDDFLAVSSPLNIRSLYFDKTYDIQSGETISVIQSFRNIESVSFGLGFREPLNPKFLNRLIESLPNLRKLSFNCGTSTLSWETLAELQLTKIKSLYVRMSEAKRPLKIVAPLLEEFKYSGDDEEKLTPIELIGTPRQRYDFSGMPNLHTLDIRRWGMLDYASLLSLKNLKKLIISDVNLTKLQWLSPGYQLETLCVWGALESLDGLATQQKLRTLDLSRNKLSDIREVGLLNSLQRLDLRFNPIADASPIEELDGLEYLNLISETPISEGTLRSKGIKTVLLTFEDRDYDSIGGKINDFSLYAYSAIKGEDKRDLTHANDFIRRRTIIERQKPYEERLKSKIQQAFDLSLREINPFNFQYYNFGYKQEYIRRAIVKYPFLKVTSEMEELMTRERGQVLTRAPQQPGVVFSVDEDIVRIYTKVEKGTGKFKQEYDSRYRRPISVTAARSIQTAVNKNLSIMFPGDSLDGYDVTVVYAPLYGKEVDAKIAFSVTYAIWSALNEVPVRSKSIMALRFGTNGKIVQSDLTARQINAARLQGFETIIAWGKKNETINDSGICLVKCKTATDATEEIFVD